MSTFYWLNIQLNEKKKHLNFSLNEYICKNLTQLIAQKKKWQEFIF
jgi:hypothetical protein